MHFHKFSVNAQFQWIYMYVMHIFYCCFIWGWQHHVHIEMVVCAQAPCNGWWTCLLKIKQIKNQSERVIIVNWRYYSFSIVYDFILTTCKENTQTGSVSIKYIHICLHKMSLPASVPFNHSSRIDWLVIILPFSFNEKTLHVIYPSRTCSSVFYLACIPHMNWSVSYGWNRKIKKLLVYLLTIATQSTNIKAYCQL